jgi:predicted transcriptional regulator
LKLPCEIVVRDVLPVVRSIVVKELAEKYNFTQEEIASKLGITQASVSYYLSAKRGYKTNLVKEAKLMEDVGHRIARGVAKGNITQMEIIENICRMCRTFRSRDIVCEIHESLFPSLKGEVCKVCVEPSKKRPL